MAKGRTKRTKGNYYAPHPVDFAILERLPEEGSVLGYHVLASTVPRLTEDLNKDIAEEGQVTPSNVSGRLVSMKSQGLVKTVRLMGADKWGWQRTKKGELLYAEQTGKSIENGPPQLRAVEGG